MPPIGEQELSVGANPRAHRGVHLVAISKRVNQTGLERLGGSPRPGVGELAHAHGLDRSTSGDRGDGFGEDGLGEAVERDAVGLGVLGAHVAVGGVLELVALLELRLDAQAVERAADERRLHPDAEQAESPAGLQPDCVEAGRQHIRGHVAGALAEALRPRERRFATRGEGAHTKAQLLHRRPRQRSSDLGDQPDDVTVGCGLVQRTQDGTELGAAAGAQPGQRVVRVHFGGKLGEVHLEQQERSVTRARQHANHFRARPSTCVSASRYGACRGSNHVLAAGCRCRHGTPNRPR